MGNTLTTPPDPKQASEDNVVKFLKTRTFQDFHNDLHEANVMARSFIDSEGRQLVFRRKDLIKDVETGIQVVATEMQNAGLINYTPQSSQSTNDGNNDDFQLVENDQPEENLETESESSSSSTKSKLVAPWFWRALIRVEVAKTKMENGNIGDLEEEKLLDVKQFYAVFIQMKSAFDKVDVKKRVMMSSSTSNAIAEVLDGANGGNGGDGELIRQGSGFLSLPEDDSEEMCIVCMENNPEVVLACAHSYCKTCIEEWKERSNTCPMCRAVADQDDEWDLVSKPSNKEVADFLNDYVDQVIELE